MKTVRVLLCCLLLLFGVFLIFTPSAPDTSYYNSVVMVSLQNKLIAGVREGHGTGFYIGNGLVLTAAHVADAAKDEKMKNDQWAITDADGTTTLEVELLWSDDEDDIALFKINPEKLNLTAVGLRCSLPIIGEQIEGIGHPLNMKNIHTYGNIAGTTKKRYEWKEVTPVDLTVYKGMSGGPVFDLDHKVVAMMNGVVVVAGDMFDKPAPMRLGWAVPSSEICEALKKHAA
jgi:S1-C subfamily serine protease